MDKGVIQTHSVISFRAFEARQKSRLKAKYPFLSADQINGKLKKQWQELEESERKHFTKKCLKVTPVKEPCTKASKGKGKERPKAKVFKSKRQTRDNLQVCDTPEYVNIEKLNDFRKQHKETYNNDFFLKNATTLASLQNTGDIFGPSYSCQEKRKSSSPSRALEVQDNTPFKQQGILKSRDPGTSDQAKAHVSFNSSVDEREGDECSYSFKSDDGDLSDDDDTAVLLRRGDLDPNAVDSFSNSFDDDSDNDVLIRREMDDYTDVTNQDGCQNPTDGENDKQLTAECIGKRKKSSEFGEPKKAKLDKDSKKINNDANNAVEVNEESSENTMGFHNNTLFKSPLQTKSKRLRKPNASPKANQLAFSRTPVIGTNAALLVAQTTPAIQGNQEETSNFTPQMDEVLQQLALNEASKAPHKKKSDHDFVVETEKLKALVAGRRVTRSLMSQSSERIAEKENIQTMKANSTASAEKQKAGKGKMTGEILGRKSRKGKRNHVKQLDGSNGILMNASGDACQTICKDKSDVFTAEATHMERVENLQRNSKQTDAEELGTAVGHNYLMDVSEGERTDQANDCEDANVPSLLDSDSSTTCSSQESSSSMADTQNKRYRPKMNPTLLRALKGLQMSPEGGPNWSSSEQSDGSSPRLLSPALSGVSELSSVSSRGDSDKATQDSNMTETTGNAKGIEEPMGEDLCGMFGEVTPPDRKTRGLYKTQRLLASAGSDKSKNFKQLFQDDEDFLFS